MTVTAFFRCFIVMALLMSQGCGTTVYLADAATPSLSNSKSHNDAVAHQSIHVVSKGETLYSIAFSYSVDYRSLARWNSIGDDYRIIPGQRLELTESATLEKEGKESQNNGESVNISTVIEAPKASDVQAPPPKPAISVTPITKKESVQTSVIPPPRESVTTPQVTRKKSANAPSTSVEDKLLSGKPKWRWPSNGKVINTFSTSPTGNKGLNIAGKIGEPVRAAAAGRVVYAGTGLRGFGQLIIVKHNDEFLSAYAHNDKLLVQENDVVTAGKIIAELGRSGTDREQLHFEIRYQGQPVDPLKHLPKR